MRRAQSYETLQILTLAANAVYKARMRANHFWFGTNHFKLSDKQMQAQETKQKETERNSCHSTGRKDATHQGRATVAIMRVNLGPETEK